MARGKTPLDPRRWFDQTLPRTLQIALYLLYFEGFFLLLHFLDRTDPIGYLRDAGALGLVGAVTTLVAHIGGGFLLANGRRLGHHLAVAAAFSPFIVRLWVYLDDGLGVRLYSVITGRDLVQFMFEAGLLALVLHPESIRHARVWLA